MNKKSDSPFSSDPSSFPQGEDTNQRRLLATCVSLLLFFLASILYYGWVFGVGLVVLLFVHECGHVWACRRIGLPVGDMFFIPFLGAFVTLQHRNDRAENAFVGLMGPVFGAVGGVVCTILAYMTSNNHLMQLAECNFVITFLNLIPISPLDGSWIVPLLLPQRWANRSAQRSIGAAYFGIVAILIVVLYYLPQRPFFPNVH